MHSHPSRGELESILCEARLKLFPHPGVPGSVSTTKTVHEIEVGPDHGETLGAHFVCVERTKHAKVCGYLRHLLRHLRGQVTLLRGERSSHGYATAIMDSRVGV